MMRILVFFVILTSLATHTHCGYNHFNGGSFSFSVRNESGKLIADLDVITGWVFQKGPCGPNCSRADIKTSTLSRRNATISTTGDSLYFGNWTAEYKFRPSPHHPKVTKTTDLNHVISTNMTEIVLAMNTKAMWEQELMRVSVELEKDTADYGEDIYFEGDSWHNLTLQPSGAKWHIQAKIDKRVRNDTGLPNKSPRVFTKPYYRVKLNQTSSLHIAAADPDGDVVTCKESEFSELGPDLAHKKIPGVEILENCTVVIDTSSDKYTDNTWCAIALTVRDYNIHNITLDGNLFKANGFSLSGTAVQFLVLVLEDLNAPTFVSPTPTPNHHFILYAGTVWRQLMYAKANENTTISYFNVIGRQQEDIHVTKMEEGDELYVKYVEIKWIPQDADVGNHIFCVTAVDGTGVDSDEDRCFTVTVKPDRFHHRSTNASNLPYFIDLPAFEQTVECKRDTTCTLPLYVISKATIKDINIKRTFFTFTEIGPIGKMMHNGTEVYEGDISFRDSEDGIKEICLQAVDVNGAESEVVCIRSVLQPPDPCVSNPCKNGATCARSEKDAAVYVCYCYSAKFSGRNCEKTTDFCESNPCQNNGSCFENPPGTAKCYCSDKRYTGDRCRVKKEICLIDTCNGHGSCKDGVCTCFDRYGLPNCSNDTCPGEPADRIVCGDPACNPDPCHKNGLCLPGGICLCSMGFRGNDNCSLASGDAAVVLGKSGTKFVPPSPAQASVIQCYIERPCRFAVYLTTASGVQPTLNVDWSSDDLKGSSISNVSELQFIPGLTKMFTATVIVDGPTADGTTYLCLKAAAGFTDDRLCLEIFHTQDPLKLIESKEFKEQNMIYRFIEPTPNDGTVIICEKDKECSMLLYTNMVNSTCEAVASGHDGVHMLSTHNTSSNCVTEISISYQVEGHTLTCFVASSQPSSQTRCYDIVVYKPGKDQCKADPCLNGGDCFHSGQDQYRCICKNGYTGNNCEKGACVSSDKTCDAKAYCYANYQTKRCICPLGMTGVQCRGRSTSSANSSVFTDTAIPVRVTCIINRECSIPLGVSSIMPSRSAMAFGFVSPHIRVGGIATEPSEIAETKKTTAFITPLQLGMKLVCVQTIFDNSNEDEICITVNVTSDSSTLYGFQGNPHFIAPSLPNKAEVRCKVDDNCHVIYHVTPGDDHAKECTNVYFTKTPFEHSHIFTSCSGCTTGYVKKNCSIDVSVIPPGAELGATLEVCVAVELTVTKLKGEERCFNVTIQSATDFGAKTGCQNRKCKNGGFCDSHKPSNPVCICRPGYSGIECESKTAGGGTNSGTFISTFGVPAELSCSLNSSCSVNFHITGPLAPTSNVSLGYTDPNLVVETKPTLKPMPEGNGYTGTVIVNPSEVGESKICIQSGDKGRVDDELCMEVHVGGGQATNVDKAKPYYIDPTPAKGSTILCKLGQACYIELYYPEGTAFGSSRICPNIEDTSRVAMEGVHIFVPTLYGQTCKSTLTYLSASTDSLEEKSICTRIFVPGKPGEERCFNIKLNVDVKTSVVAPCRAVTCHDHGKCIADFTTTQTRVCICQKGFEGTDCNTISPKLTNLPGVTNPPVGAETSPHHFDGTSAILREITCIKGEYCNIPIAVSGTALPVFGYVDPHLHAEKPTFLPGGNVVTTRVMSNTTGIQHICLQTTVNGTAKSTNVDEVCIVVKISPGPAPPIDTTKPNFTKGSLTDNSSAACDLDKNCHIPVYSTPFGTTCPEVRECAPGVTGVHVFETQLVNGTCVTDAVLKTSTTPSNETVCISAGPDGEERHIRIEINEFNKKKFGPCQTQHCVNGGKCVADFTGGSAQAVCLCPSGHTGAICETAVTLAKPLPGVSPAQNTTSETPYFVGTGGIPKNIKCFINQPCRIPVPYHGTNPPLLGYVDPGLNHTQPTLLPDGTALTEVIPTAGGTHRICWQTTLNGTASSKNVDEICTNVTVETGTPPVQSKPHFGEGTVPDQSTVACDTNTQCHIPFFSEPEGGKCPDATECPPGVTGTHVFEAKQIGGKCVTEVVYKTSNTSTTKALCISAGKNGEERHIQVEVEGFTGFGPCQKLHCENGGKCVANTTSGVCTCPPLISGPQCKTVSPCKSTYCKYGGVCREDISDRTKAECICINGYEGPNCDKQSHVTTDNLPGVTGNFTSTPLTPHIDGAVALIKDIVCAKGKPCQITFPFTGPKDKTPLLAKPLPSGLAATNLTTLPVPGGPDAGPRMAVTTVTPNGDGPFKVCAQTTVDGDEQGVNVDEVCVLVKVASTPTTTPDPSLPHFGTSTPTNGSTMTCNTDIKCHLIFVTEENSPGVCAPVDQCSTKLPDSFVLHTRPVGGKCVTDIVVTTGSTPVNQSLCVSSGPGGEERHYELETKDYTATEFGPCQKLHCKNGGKCDSRSGTAKCVCPHLVKGTECQDISVCKNVACGAHGHCVEEKTGSTVGHACACERGFEGEYCNKTSSSPTTLKGVEYAPATTTKAPHFDGHGSIPTEINCVANSPCKLPITYFGYCDNPPVLGYVDPDLTHGKPTVVSVGCSDPRLHTVVTTINPTSPGNKQLCLQTTHNGTKEGINVDEICIQVNVKPAGTAMPLTCDPTAKPCFDTTNGTNLPEWSKITCDTDTSCHHRVVSDLNSSGLCSPVEQCTPKLFGLVTLATKPENGKCVTDVVFRTGGSDTNNTMCLSAGPGGEERHYSVETKHSTEFGPCQKLHCKNGGKCISQDDQARCVCPKQISGNLCDMPSPCIGVNCNHGVCIEQYAGHLAACACQDGYEDSDNCKTPSPPPTGLPGLKNPPTTVGTETPHLNEKSTLPKQIICYKDTKCDIPIIYHGSSTKPPVLGHVDSGIQVTLAKLTSTVGPGKSSHTAFTEVTPTETGTHTICIQTTKDGQIHGENVDEICVDVIVQGRDKAPSRPAPSVPQFHRSQAPDKSTFTCQPGISCHMEVLTKKLFNGTCAAVDQCQTHAPMEGVNVFPTMPSPGGIKLPNGTIDKKLCVTDVVIRTGNVQTSGTMCLRAGPGGEQRTYTVETKIQTVFGPCQQLHCKNGGSCDARSSTTALCCCPAPFIGQTCEEKSNDTSIVPGTMSCDPSKATSIDTCDVKVGKDKARSLSKAGQVSCKCAVEGKPGTTVEIIKRNPNPVTSGLFMSAAYGAGGMTGAMIIGVIVYVIVTKAKQPEPRVHPRQRPPRR